MNDFAWALAAFVLLHIGLSATAARGAFVRAIGETAYRALFSLVSAALLVLLVRGYREMRFDHVADPLTLALWSPPEWLRWPAYALIALGLLLALVGLFTPGPTVAGFERRALAAAEPARGVLRITRHPFLWGVALWAAGHLLVNGERFALMLFGGLGFMVLFGTRSIDRKGRARDPEGWARFEAATSNVPFVAIAQGRNRLNLGEMAWRAALALALVALLAWAHPMLIGVPIA